MTWREDCSRQIEAQYEGPGEEKNWEYLRKEKVTSVAGVWCVCGSEGDGIRLELWEGARSCKVCGLF